MSGIHQNINAAVTPDANCLVTIGEQDFFLTEDECILLARKLISTWADVPVQQLVNNHDALIAHYKACHAAGLNPETTPMGTRR